VADRKSAHPIEQNLAAGPGRSFTYIEKIRHWETNLFCALKSK
jgi:hypothetical protein